MAQIVPMLMAPSIEETLDYYRNVLGWELGFSMPGPDGKLVHGEARFHGALVMFGTTSHLPAEKLAHLGTGVVIYIEADHDIDAYYEQVRSRGAKIADEIGDRFWGDRTFDLVDLNGYTLTIAKHVKDVDFANMPPAEAVPA